MNKKNLILVIIGIIVILGFVIGGLWPESSALCTEMLCICDKSQSDKEIPCNSCAVVDPIFITGIFNIVRECGGREIIICENYQYVRTRLDIDSSSCNYEIRFFSFR